MSGGAVVVYWICRARLGSATPIRRAARRWRSGLAPPVKRNQAAARLLRVAARLEKEAQP